MEESVDLILCDPRNRLAGEVRIQLKAVAGRGVEDVQLGTHQPGKGRLARPVNPYVSMRRCAWARVSRAVRVIGAPRYAPWTRGREFQGT